MNMKVDKVSDLKKEENRVILKQSHPKQSASWMRMIRKHETMA